MSSKKNHGLPDVNFLCKLLIDKLMQIGYNLDINYKAGVSIEKNK